MKKILLLTCLFISANALACSVDDAKVIEVFEYHDGEIFVNFDKATNCSCSQTHRMAFSSSDQDKDFIKSMVLLAYASEKKVHAGSNIAGCSVHGNTPELTFFRLKP